jgi:hypothetical protein
MAEDGAWAPDVDDYTMISATDPQSIIAGTAGGRQSLECRAGLGPRLSRR